MAGNNGYSQTNYLWGKVLPDKYNNIHTRATVTTYSTKSFYTHTRTPSPRRRCRHVLGRQRMLGPDRAHPLPDAAPGHPEAVSTQTVPLSPAQHHAMRGKARQSYARDGGRCASLLKQSRLKQSRKRGGGDTFMATVGREERSRGRGGGR